jgi:hypothetical protein
MGTFAVNPVLPRRAATRSTARPRTPAQRSSSVERETVMPEIRTYLASTAAGAEEVRTAAVLLVVLLATFTAMLAKLAEAVDMAVRTLVRVLKALLVALVAGLIVASVVILALADLLSG